MSFSLSRILSFSRPAPQNAVRMSAPTAPLPAVAAAPPVAELDLLVSPATRIFHLELTSQCNLRCVYCAVSQPTYNGSDMELVDFESLLATLKERRVQTLVVNGHGETTTVPGWHKVIIRLADAGFAMSIISNFARLLTDEELEAMARIANIQVSVDTFRPELLRKIRRRVDLGNILVNMKRVHATAMKLSLPPPRFTWSCVVTDKVALELLDYLNFGLACGVREFTLCNLQKYDDVPDGENVNHVTTMPRDKLEQFSRILEEAETLTKNAGATLIVLAGLQDSIRATLATREAV